jgi:hypothetical protein
MLDPTDSQVRPSTQVRTWIPLPHRNQERGIRGVTHSSMSEGNEVSIHLMTNHMGSSVRDWFRILVWYSDRPYLIIRTFGPHKDSLPLRREYFESRGIKHCGTALITVISNAEQSLV